MAENKFASVEKRVEEIENQVGGGIVILEEGVYPAKVIGVGYRKDVEKKNFDGDLETIDEIVYMVHVVGDEGISNMIKEVKASAHEKSNAMKILSKFDLPLSKFYELLGKDIRVNVEEKVSKAGKDYNVITGFLKPKKAQEAIEFTQVTLPAFFGRDITDGLVDLMPGVTIKEETEGERRDAEAALEDAADTDDIGEVLDALEYDID